MFVQIDVDEIWPVYTIRHPFSFEIERGDCGIDVPDDFYREYALLQDRYQEMQKKLKEYHEQSEKIRSSQNAVWPTLHEGTERFYGTSFHTKRIRHA